MLAFCLAKIAIQQGIREIQEIQETHEDVSFVEKRIIGLETVQIIDLVEDEDHRHLEEDLVLHPHIKDLVHQEEDQDLLANQDDLLHPKEARNQPLVLLVDLLLLKEASLPKTENLPLLKEANLLLKRQENQDHLLLTITRRDLLLVPKVPAQKSERRSISKVIAFLLDQLTQMINHNSSNECSLLILSA